MALGVGTVGNTGTPVSFIGTATVDDFTILRTRGSWIAADPVGMVENEVIMIAVGLGVIPNVVGQTEFPTPIVDADWDGWFLHETIMLRASPASTNQNGLAEGYVGNLIDSKAMRKVHGGDSVLASFDTFNISGTAVTGLVAAFWSRFLLKLS